MIEPPNKNNKRYRIRILMQSGTSQQWSTEEFEAESFHTSDRGYFYFSSQGKPKYFPVNHTIVEEI